MNASTQAQKSFRTFILTLSISLILFSAIYYVVSSRKENTDAGLAENSGVAQKQEESGLYDYDKGPDAGESVDDAMMNNPVVSGAADEYEGEPDGSAFGGLAEQQMFIEGQVKPTDSEPAEAMEEEVSGPQAAASDTGPSGGTGSPVVAGTETSSTSPVSDVKGVSTSNETVTTSASEEEKVSAKLEGDTMVSEPADEEAMADDNLAMVSDTTTTDPAMTEPEMTEPEPEVAGVSDQKTSVEEPDPAVTSLADNGPNVGGPTVAESTTVAAAVTSTKVNEDPQVLAGADETTTTPVPDTGLLSMTVGLGISLVTFLFAMFWIIKGPRKMAMHGFEKDLTKDR